MLDIPACKTKTSEKTVSDVEAKRWIGVVSVVFKSEYRKILAERADAVSSVVDSFVDFSDPATDAPIVQNEIVEKNPS